MAVSRVQGTVLTPLALNENSAETTALFTRTLASTSSPPPATPEGKAPEFTQYSEIEDYGPDAVRYKLNGGNEWVVVRKVDNPQLYDQISADKAALAAVRQSETEGYALADGDDAVPAFQDYKDIGPSGELAPGTIRYEVRQPDGSIKKVVVAERVNPGLYAEVSRHGKVLAEVHRLGRNHYTMAGPNDKAPPFEAYIPQSITVNDELGIISYITDDDQTITVVRDVNPGMYEDVHAAKTAHDALGAGGNGYERPPADLTTVDIAQVGPPGEFGEGVIRFSTKDGKKYIVNKFTDPALYAQAVANYESTKIDEVNKIREKYGLPKLSDVDILNMMTGEKSNDKELSVGEYAVTKLLEEYRKGVEEGKYKPDSVQARLVRAFEAKAALAAGRDITPYIEAVWGGGTTNRSFGDPVHLTEADMHDIIDANAVDKAITELLSDETVRKDYEAKLGEAIKKIPEDKRRELTDKLAGTLESDKYVEYLAELDKLGLKHMGSKDTSTMLTSLALLDKDKAEVAAQKLMVNTLTHELNNMDFSKISEENQDLALKDMLFHFSNMIKAGGNIIRTGMGSWEKFIGDLVGDKTQLTRLRKVLTDAFPNGILNNDDHKQIMDKISGSMDKFVPGPERAQMYNFLSSMASSGFLGSMAGGISLLGSIYQLAGKGGALAETTQQRLGIANGFISFLSMGSHFATLGDKLLNKIGVTGFGDVMGLGKTMPEIWGSKGLYNLETKGPFKNQADLRAEIETVTEKLKTDFPEIKRKPLDAEQLKRLEDFTKSQGTNVKIDLSKAPQLVKNIAASALKVTGAVTDFAGGVLDIVMGAMTINSGIKSGSAIEKASGALQVISGTMGLGAGALGIAALFGNIGVASAAIGPLFLIGAVIGFIGAIVSVFVDHGKKQAQTDKEGKWFIDAANDGLLYGDWGDKVEYARYATKTYLTRDAPDDQSIFDFQKAEWDHFRATPPKDGSSINRLDNTKHIDYNKDNKGMPGHEYDDIPITYGGGV